MKKKWYNRTISVGFGVSLPLISSAEKVDYTRTIDSSNVKTLVESLTNVLNTWVLGILTLFALVNFIYTVVEYIAASEDSTRKEKAKKVMWGLIGLFVILSVWSLVAVLANTFGVTMGGRLKGWN